MEVRDAMTKDVCAVQATDPVWRAAELMRQRNIGSVLVYEGSDLCGIVTDRDLAIRSLASRYLPDGPVREFMTHSPICIDQSADLDDALRLMVERKVGRLPVVDRGHNVVGVISFGDLAELPELMGHGLARSG